MALTGVIQRRDTKAIITQNPPRVGEIVFALDTEEYGSIMNGVLVWKKFDDLVKSVAGRTGNVTLSKFDVQLENVDNTSDMNKPISTATQLIIDTHNTTINAHGVTTELLGLENVDNTSDMDKPVSTATQIAIDLGVGAVSEVNNALNLGSVPASEYALVSDYFTKLETQDLLNTKTDIGVSYTKPESDSLLNTKANQSDLTLNDQRTQTLEISMTSKSEISYVDSQDNALDLAKADKVTVAALDVIVSDNTDNIVQNRLDIDTNIASIDLLQIQKADKSYVDQQDSDIQTQVTTNSNDILNLTAGGVTKSYVDGEIDTVNLSLAATNLAKADKSYVDAQDVTIQGNINVLSTEKASITYVDNAIAGVDGVSQTYVDTKIDYLSLNKADVTYVDDQDALLDAKISTNTTTITDQTAILQASITNLENTGASTVYVDAQDLILDTKIDTNVTMLSNEKADVNYVDTQDLALDTKINTNVSALTLDKADLSYVNTELNDLSIYVDTQDTTLQTNIDTLTTNKADITYVDSLISGLDAKESVRVSTTENITLSGLLVIDGITLLENDRVLVKNQTDLTQNGLYTASSVAWVRSEDADNNPGSEVNNGMYCFVNEGATNNNTGWILSATDPVTLNTTPLTFNKFSNIVINATDILDKLKTVDGSGSGLDADLLDGHDTVFFAPQSDTYTKAEVDGYVADATMSDAGILEAVKRVDGTGSGIDADLLDGYNSTYFAPASTIILKSVIEETIIAGESSIHLSSNVFPGKNIDLSSSNIQVKVKDTEVGSNTINTWVNSKAVVTISTSLDGSSFTIINEYSTSLDFKIVILT